MPSARPALAVEALAEGGEEGFKVEGVGEAEGLEGGGDRAVALLEGAGEGPAGEDGLPFAEVEGEELIARCFCHEIDHLDGIVYTEVMERFLTEEELNGEG